MSRPAVSALFWFPKIAAAGLLVPRTLFVPFDYHACIAIIENENPQQFLDLEQAVKDRSLDIGFPVFIRTDIGSAKHSGPEGYFAADAAGVGQVLFNTLEDHELKHMFGPPAEAIMVREFLSLESSFTAFGGLPISREWRIFANAREVICAHPYWPHFAIEEHRPSAENWRDLLLALHEPPEELDQLKDMAIAAAKACGDLAWSIDLARDVSGKWWLTDMAPMEQSWHWPECPLTGGAR